MKTTFAAASFAACLTIAIPAMAQDAGNHMGADAKTTTGAPGPMHSDPMVKDGMANTASTGSMKMDSKTAMKMKKSKKPMAMKKPMTDAMPVATPSAGGMSSGGMTAPSH